MDRITIDAPDGMIYTDGKERFGSTIYLEEGLREEDFHLITWEEYEQYLAAQESMLGVMPYANFLALEE